MSCWRENQSCFAVVCIVVLCGGCFADSDDPEPMGGAECTSNSECDSGAQCMMGVCQVPCASRDGCASNEACTEGICVVAEGTTCSANDPCADGFTCIGEQCAPLLGPGGACTGESQCASGACVDGVCCNRACDATCESCLNVDTGLADGVCALATAGRDPGERCGDLSSCSIAGTCGFNNGEGCASGADCVSGHCVDGVCCDVGCGTVCRSCLGSVSGGADGVCTALAEGSERVEQNPTFEDCPGVQTCDGSGACFAKQSGDSCAGDDECASGFCTDGICCDERCNGACQQCGTGSCETVSSGADPDTCQNCFGDGTCEGLGVLEPCTIDSECGSRICVGDQCRLANGANCASDAECLESCILGICDAPSGIAGACNTPPDCQEGLECFGNSCLVPNGGGCSGNGDCTNVCVSGVCREASAATEPCDGSESTDCISGLGCFDSQCLIPTGSVLSCQDPNECQERICFSGTCFAPVEAGGACEVGAQCPVGADCVEGRCLFPIGAVCGGDAECSSNNCAGGICRESQLGEPCAENADCGPGLACGPNSFGGTLVCRSATVDVALDFFSNNLEFSDSLVLTASITCVSRLGTTVTRTIDASGRENNRDDIFCALGAVATLQCSSNEPVEGDGPRVELDAIDQPETTGLFESDGIASQILQVGRVFIQRSGVIGCRTKD